MINCCAVDLLFTYWELVYFGFYVLLLNVFTCVEPWFTCIWVCVWILRCELCLFEAVSLCFYCCINLFLFEILVVFSGLCCLLIFADYLLIRTSFD